MAVFQITPAGPGELWTHSGFPFITRTQWETIKEFEDVERRNEPYHGIFSDPMHGVYLVAGGILFAAQEAGSLLAIVHGKKYVVPVVKTATVILAKSPQARALATKALMYAGKSAFEQWLSRFPHRVATTVLRGEPVKRSWRKPVADRMVKFFNNPYGRTVAQHSQAVAQMMRHDALTVHDITRFQEWLLQEMPERALRKLAEGIRDLFQGEEEMPYNRRTGQWYPARRRYGNYGNRGGYRRGGYSRGYTPRRRSYRRW